MVRIRGKNLVGNKGYGSLVTLTKSRAILRSIIHPTVSLPQTTNKLRL